MLVDAEQRRDRWARSIGRLTWNDDERGYAELLDALSRERIENAIVESEMDSTASHSPEDLREEQREIVEDELADARNELGEFRVALEDVRSRAGADGVAEVAYDSANPVHDVNADVLIQYLVRTGYAEVRTEEPEEGHYVYYIRVDWDGLRALSSSLEHPLPL